MKRKSKLHTRSDQLKERVELALIVSAAAAVVTLAVFGVVLLMDSF